MDVNEYIEIIDSKFDILYHKMNYEEYLNFIKNTKPLNAYDTMLGYNDIGYLITDSMIQGMSTDFLEEVNQILQKKIDELNN